MDQPVPHAHRSEASGPGAGTVTLGEQGAGGQERSTLLDGVVRPEVVAVVRSIGRLLAAVGDLLDLPVTTARVHVGAVELDYRALHRPDGAVQLRRLDRPVRALAVTDRHDVTAPAAVEEPREAPGHWERGVKAAQAGAHTDALRHFEQEAEQLTARGVHARAALSYRCASAQADRLGRTDLANRLLRLAGKHYLSAAETPQTPHQAMRQAYEMAAKCFLQAGNLPLAETSIRQAISLDEVLG